MTLPLAALHREVGTPPMRSAVVNLSMDQAEELVRIHRSPLLVTSKSKLVENFAAWSAALPGVELHYAVKANPQPAILEVLAGQGASVDICSLAELEAALDAGFSVEKVLHTHPCKTVDNLAGCRAAGVQWFTFDNPVELEKIASHAADVDLLLRLAVAGSSTRVNLSTKFGTPVGEAIGLLQTARRMGLRVRGFSFHVGTQCVDPGDFARVIAKVREIWDRTRLAGFELDVLDIGGGFPVPYRDAVPSIETFGSVIRESLEESFGHVSIRTLAEPGRALVADSTTLVMTVIGKSVRNGVPWYFVDDGIYGSFSRRTFQHGDFVLVADGMDRRDLHSCVVAGPTCDSNDVICTDWALPDLSVGERLLVPTMGAYAGAVACGFNGCPQAGFVMID